jgi:hypothetical protein
VICSDPPSLHCSGRRIGAGPGLWDGTQPSIGRLIATALVIGLALTMVVAPASIAVLAMIWGERLDLAGAAPAMPFQLTPILDGAGALSTFVLAVGVIRSIENEP